MLSLSEQLVFGSVLGLLILIGSCAYIMVVCVTYFDKKFRRNIASIFLFNLLTIDLANLLLVMPFSISSLDGSWGLGEGWEKACAFLGTWFEVASVLALSIISLDRMVAVMKPFVYIARMTKRKAAILVLLTWCQATVFSIVPIPLDWYVFNQTYMSCTFNSLNKTSSFRVFMIFFILCNFLLSLLTIMGTYIYIFRIARYHRKSIAVAVIPRLFLSLNAQVNLDGTRMKEIRLAGKMFIVIGAFIVCHIPYAITRSIDVLGGNYLDDVSINVTIATKWLSFSKSAFDPFIYFILQRRFRKTLTKAFRSLVPSNRVAQEKTFARRQTRIVTLGGSDDATHNNSPTVARRHTLSTNIITVFEKSGCPLPDDIAVVRR